ILHFMACSLARTLMIFFLTKRHWAVGVSRGGALVLAMLTMLAIPDDTFAQIGTTEIVNTTTTTPARLLRQPTISATHIAFAYGGDLWIVDRQGGEDRRLTSTPAVESDPHISPDGRSI